MYVYTYTCVHTHATCKNIKVFAKSKRKNKTVNYFDTRTYDLTFFVVAVVGECVCMHVCILFKIIVFFMFTT